MKDICVDGYMGSWGIHNLDTLSSVPDSTDLFVSGIYSGTIILAKDEPGELIIESPETEGHNSSIFLARYTVDGEVVWGKNVAWVDDFSMPWSLDTLSDGTVVLGGQYQNTAVFGPGEMTETTLISNSLSANVASDFLAAFSSDGSLLWVFGQADGSDHRVFSVGTYGKDTIYTAGFYSGEMDFGTGSTDIHTLPLNGVQEVFLYRLDRVAEVPF